jgi:hypothetical protein
MTEIRSVPAAQFPDVYPRIARYFASFVERAHGGLLPGFLESEVIAGRAHVLVPVVDGEICGCALTSIAPDGTVTLAYCSGDGREDWQEAMIEAVEREAPNVEIICRPGWVRALRLADRGYRETHRIMERRAEHV